MKDIAYQLAEIGARWARFASKLCAPPYLSSMLDRLDTLYSDPVLDLAEICQLILERSNGAGVESETLTTRESTARLTSSPDRSSRAARIAEAQRMPRFATPGVRSSTGSTARATPPADRLARSRTNSLAWFTPLSEQARPFLRAESLAKTVAAPDELHTADTEPAHLDLARVDAPAKRSSVRPASTGQSRHPTSRDATPWDAGPQAAQPEPLRGVRMARNPSQISAILQANLASGPVSLPADELTDGPHEPIAQPLTFAAQGESHPRQVSHLPLPDRRGRSASESDLDVSSASTLANGLDWERFMEKLTEHLEFEFLRTYGTSGG